MRRDAVGRHRGEAVDAAALLADLAAQREHQDLGALHLDAVVVLGEARLRQEGGCPGAGDPPGEIPHARGLGAGDTLHRFRRVVGEETLQLCERRIAALVAESIVRRRSVGR